MSVSDMAGEKVVPARSVAIALGGLSLALILGALGFQYLDGIPPCEMCHWQRWPHIAAAIVGLGGGLLLPRAAPDSQARRLAWATAFLVALSGVIAAYHAGVEWKWWPGPSACTGNSFHYTGTLDLNAKVVLCDIAAWRLFGISLAGYNAILSLGGAALGSLALSRSARA